MINLSKIKSSAKVYVGDYKTVLKKLQGNKFDFIFADPPYAAGFYDKVLDLVENCELFAKNGIIILEYSAQDDLLINEKRYIRDTRKFGSVKVSFLTAKEGLNE